MAGFWPKNLACTPIFQNFGPDQQPRPSKHCLNQGNGLPDFNSAIFKDHVDVDEKSHPIGMFGIPWTGISQKALQSLGKSFNVCGYSSMKKQEVIDVISATYINRELYETGNSRSSKQPTRKHINNALTGC